jgi:hypothetical protein
MAEGSDWFWWYGDDRSSGMDDVFDATFRGHLKSVYRLSGARIPASLEQPIKRSALEPRGQNPKRLLRVTLDGRRTSFFEWHAGGRFRPEAEASAMERAQAGAIAEVAFGFDLENFFLALDFGDRKNTILGDDGSVHVVFLTPDQHDLVVMGPGRMRLGTVDLSTVAIGEILELAVPWKLLAAAAGEEVRFFVEVRRGGVLLERAPRGCALRVVVPGQDFESREWSV